MDEGLKAFLLAQIFLLPICIWVYLDAKKRNLYSFDAFFWAFLTYLFLIVFLPAWLITRPKLESEKIDNPGNVRQCPHCNKYFDTTGNYCPHCGKRAAGGEEG